MDFSKISELEGNKATDEILLIESSKNRMEAYATFMPPVNNGKMLTMSDINKILKESGITYGIDVNFLKAISTGARTYGKRYVLARGKEAVTGKNGTLEYMFDTSQKSFKPKELDDGSVDFRDLNLIELAEEGQILVQVIPHTEGIDGCDVYGMTIQGRDGKKAPRIPKGKNTVVSEDGMKLISEAAGQIIFLDGKVSVSEVLEIAGDVGVSTGNVNFNGSVVVKGNVLTDYKIVALGNVEVRGLVEGAEILCEGNVNISKGVNGMNKAHIESKGNVNALIIKDANVIAGGDIYADGVMHSKIKCNGKIVVKGKKGLLVGGAITAKDAIEANVIGSPMATVTDISVGLDADIYEKYKNYMHELGILQKEYEELSKTIHSMTKIKEINNLPSSKRNSYIKTIYDAQTVKKKLEALQEEIIVIKGELDNFKYHGKVTATKVIHPGVSIQIGNGVLNLRDEVYNSEIINDEGRAKIVPL